MLKLEIELDDSDAAIVTAVAREFDRTLEEAVLFGVQMLAGMAMNKRLGWSDEQRANYVHAKMARFKRWDEPAGADSRPE